MRWLTSALLVLAAAAVTAAEDDTAKADAGKADIHSALGMTLGKTYKTPGKKKKDGPAAEAKTVTDRDGTVFQVYTPEKNQDPFTEYLVCVAPKTRVIAQIMARAKFDSKDAATAARDKILKVLEGRYGTRAAGGDSLVGLAGMLDGAVILQSPRYIMVTVEPEGAQFLLCLRYGDKTLTSKVKNEHVDTERERDLAPGEKLLNNAL